MSNLEDLNENVVSMDEEEEKELTTPEILAAFNDSVDSDSTDDQIKVAMLSAGAAFAGVTSLFNKLMVATGRAMSKTDKIALVTGACVDQDISTKEGFEAAILAIQEGSEEHAITDRSAAGLVRGYGKKMKREVYKAPKAEGTGRGRHGFKANFFDWLREDPTRTKEDLVTLVHEFGTRNVLKDLPFYDAIRVLANDIVAGTKPSVSADFNVPAEKLASEVMDASAEESQAA